MQLKAEKLLNPNNYHLSPEAKKRLRWLYLLYYEKQGNVTQASNKAGISRQWLSEIKSIFESNNRDPRSLEPLSKAPHHTSKRKRISQEVENKILEIKDKYGWGKEKISANLFTDYGIKVHYNTVNKYLHIHKRIDPRLSLKNIKAFADKKQRETEKIIFKVQLATSNVAIYGDRILIFFWQRQTLPELPLPELRHLMNFIDAKLAKNKGLNQVKLQLINCQLCSVA